MVHLTMNITIHPVGSGAVLEVVGDLDAVTAPVLKEVLAEAQQLYTSVTLDLSHIEFIDSAGLGALVCGWRRAAAKDTEFALLAPSASVQKNLEISGLGRIFTVREQIGAI